MGRSPKDRAVECPARYDSGFAFSVDAPVTELLSLSTATGDIVQAIGGEEPHQVPHRTADR